MLVLCFTPGPRSSAAPFCAPRCPCVKPRPLGGALRLRFVRRGGNALCQQRPARTERPRPRALPRSTAAGRQQAAQDNGSVPPSLAAAPRALPSASSGGAAASGLHLLAPLLRKRFIPHFFSAKAFFRDSPPSFFPPTPRRFFSTRASLRPPPPGGAAPPQKPCARSGDAGTRPAAAVPPRLRPSSNRAAIQRRRLEGRPARGRDLSRAAEGSAGRRDPHAGAPRREGGGSGRCGAEPPVEARRPLSERGGGGGGAAGARNGGAGEGRGREVRPRAGVWRRRHRPASLCGSLGNGQLATGSRAARRPRGAPLPEERGFVPPVSLLSEISGAGQAPRVLPFPPPASPACSGRTAVEGPRFARAAFRTRCRWKEEG